MKKLWIFVLIGVSSTLSALAQSEIYTSGKTSVSFFSAAPLEDIEALNQKAVSLINLKNREIVVRIPIREFQFSNKLMQQHFNENYMESEKHPYATFKGIINEPFVFTKPGIYNLTATGIFNLHGVNQKRTLSGKLSVGDQGILLETDFTVLLADHKIKIPKLVFNKIAEQIAVSTRFNYSLRQK